MELRRARARRECRALAGDGLAPARQAAVFRESGGNPFYALSLAGAAQAPARSPSSDRMAADSGVPRAVAAALLEELAALTPAARRLLDAGSIAGDPFEPELAFAIAELDPARGRWPRSTSCSSCACCRRPRVPRRFAFRHPLVRRAVYESGGRRLADERARARGRRARRARRRARHPRAPCRAVRGRRRPGGDRAAARRRRRDGAARARGRGPLVRGRAAAPARGGPARAPARPDRPRAGAALDRRPRSAAPRASARRSSSCRRRRRHARPADRRGRPRPSTSSAATRPPTASSTRRYAALADRESEDALTVLFALIAGAFFSLDVVRGLRAERGGAGGRAAARRPAPDRRERGRPRARLRQRRRRGRRRAPPSRSPSRRWTPPTTTALARHIEALNRLAWAEYLIERDGDAIRHAARGIAHRARHRAGPVRPDARAARRR